MKRIQCRCGKVLGLPGNRAEGKFRCPNCGAIMRVRGSATASPTADDYAVAANPQSAQEPITAQAPSPAPAWAPAVGRTPTYKGRTHAATILSSAEKKSDETLEPDEFPGPFLDRSAILFPWLHPTWACGLGLAFMTELTFCAVAATAFFFFVIMSGMAFVSLFTFASMVMVCLGLASYVMATFEMVVEQTAHGDNRLRRLPGYVWYELLPSLKRVFGAWATAVGVPIAISYACRDWLGAWYTPQVLILNNMGAFVLFPIFMISNSLEQSFLPIWGLFATLPRLARCGLYFAIFLIVLGAAWTVIFLLLLLLSLVHVSLVIIAAGPLTTIWLLYYAHWLGRVVRQMMALE